MTPFKKIVLKVAVFSADRRPNKNVCSADVTISSFERFRFVASDAIGLKASLENLKF